VRWNVLTDESVNEQIRERISVMRRYAFAEQDGPIIEAQQIAIDQAGEGLDPLLLSIDIGPGALQAHPSKPDRSRTDVTADGRPTILRLRDYRAGSAGCVLASRLSRELPNTGPRRHARAWCNRLCRKKPESNHYIIGSRATIGIDLRSSGALQRK
jgi:hypothetical protein